MTEVRDKRSLLHQSPNGSSALDGGEKRRKPPPPPAPSSAPSSHNHQLRNGNSLSPGDSASSGGDKIHKLSPALFQRLEKSNCSSLGGGGTVAIKGGIAGAKTPSPALKKKAKSASKLPPKPPIGGRPAKDTSSSQLQAKGLGVGLLASVTRDFSASTGHLSFSSSSSSSFSSSSSSRKQTSPHSVRVKSSSPQMASRRTAALSMDVSKIKPGVKEKPPRPGSTSIPKIVSNPHISPFSPPQKDVSFSPLRAPSPSGSPSLPRSRHDFAGSFEDSYSPPQRASPAPQSPTNNITLLAVRQPFAAGISRSTENLLEDRARRRSPAPSKVPKQRSNSDVTSPPPPAKRGPKPAPPPKKPGLKAAVLASKPAPPPKKPHIRQLKKSPDFSRRVSGHSEGVFSPTSPRGPPPPVAERVRSPGAPSDPTSSTPGKPHPVSPSSVSSPNPSSLHQPIPSTSGGGAGDVITPGASPLPSTPSPRTSQLEAVQRNADSGFVSEAAEDPASPLPEGPAAAWDEARVEKARNKRLHIAEELLQTEVTYVDRLHVIAVRFHGAVTAFNSQNKNVIPDGDVNRIFLNISQIHNLNTNILEELQKRMDTWHTREGLGDVIERLAPFLKLYAHYTSGFEDAMKLLTSWTKRDKKFDALVRDFEREISTGLGVAHYMLEPVQRIPRYRLLLTDYLKYIPPDSPDRQPTQNALEIISEAAYHINDRIKELENSNTILSIQRSLQDFEGTLLAPGRLFIRKGQLQKFSRKTTTPRMFFLFSDMLLHTEPAGTDVYKFKNEMPIFMMKVEEPAVSLVPHSFNVESTTRSLILVASSETEKKEWMMALRKAIGEERKKRASLRRELSIMVDPGVFGAQAPIMVPDKSVTMCQVCSALFTFTFRRHHCRGCGKVVCGSCSQWKAFLRYVKKSERVCDKCYYTSKSESGEEVTVVASSPKTSRRKEGSGGILDLKGYEEDTIKGGYVLSQDGRRWNRLWYQLKQDFCLYKFRAHEDIKAISALPLPGYIVKSDPETYTITLTHTSSNKKLIDTFRPENPDDFDYWVLALESVVQLKMPSLPPDSKISPPPFDERLRSQSLRNLDTVNLPEGSPLENSI